MESELSQQLKEDDNAQRLLAIPGIGAITASLLAAELGDAKHFRSGRDFSASIGSTAPVDGRFCDSAWHQQAGRQDDGGVC